MDFFHQFDLVSKFHIASPFLHEPTSNQVVSSPSRTATPSGTINNYDMGWRLAQRRQRQLRLVRLMTLVEASSGSDDFDCPCCG
ncbi:hypothetical protein TNCV_4910581 [Trichonephila clavipes]|nr:hypothetical protein TNCV_4910581 [Trichonephila clavipes]